jgi:uncharacterized protein YraI
MSALPLIGLGVLAAAALALGGKKDPFAGKPADLKAAGKFDANETQAQADAVNTALIRETDPAKLEAFAAALTPDYPNSAKLLLAKAATLRAAHPTIPPAVQIVPVSPAPSPVPVAPPPAAVVIPSPVPGLPPIVIPPIVIPTAPAPTPAPLPALVLPSPTPAPAAQPIFPAVGSTAFVATHDTGPSGDLNIRSGPSASTPSLGTVPHGSVLTISGPNTGGFFPVHSPITGVSGFASGDFLSAAPPSSAGPALLPPPPAAAIVPASTTAPIGQAQVTTNDPSPAGDLNMRSAPSASASVVMAIPKDSIVDVTGPAQNGFLPVSFQGNDGFASASFLTMQDGTTSAGYYPWGMTAGLEAGFGAWPQMSARGFENMTRLGPQRFTAGFDPGDAMPYYQHGRGQGALTTGADGVADVAQAAHDLYQAIEFHSCRASDEPIVRRFQLAALAAGLYTGRPHGSYDEATRAALGRVLGPMAPPPACFSGTGAGGPLNHDEYWMKGQ